MSGLKGLQQRAGSFVFKRELGRMKRKKKGTRIAQARDVGVLVPVNEKHDFLSAMKYVRYLKEEGIKHVSVIGYADTKERPDFLPESPGFELITRRELNRYLIPKSPAVKEFITREFDILADLSIRDHFPLNYVLGLSRARLKIGRETEAKMAHLDLMIQSDPDQGIDYLCKQFNHYLNIFNTSPKHG